MKGRNLIILVIAAVVLVALAYRSSNRQKTRHASPELGMKIFPQLAVNDVAKIVVRSSSGTATVARVNGLWCVADRFNYPAAFGRVTDLLRKLADLKVGQVVRAAPGELAGLNLASPAGSAAGAEQGPTVVELSDQAGKPMAVLHLGKEHLARPPSEARAMPGFGGYPDGRYVAAGDRVCLVADTLTEAAATPKEWLDDEFMNVLESEITDIAVTGGTNPPVHLARSKSTGSLELGALPPGKELDSGKISRLASSLSYLRYEDVADPKLPPAVTGLDQPIVFKAKTGKGEVYTLRIGKTAKDDARRYVSVNVAFEPPPAAPTGGVSAATAADTNKLAEAKAQEEAQQAAAERVAKLNTKVSPWVYLLSASQSDSLLTPASELVKDKPPPEPATNTNATAASTAETNGPPAGVASNAAAKP